MASITLGNEAQAFLERLYNAEVEVTTGSLLGLDCERSIYSTLVKGHVTVRIDEVSNLHIEIPEDPILPPEFRQELNSLTEFLRSTKLCRCIWLENASKKANVFSICPDSWVIGDPARGGLIIDHGDPEFNTRMWQWLNPDQPCLISRSPTHHVFASAAVVDEVSEKILLVVRGESTNWSMPKGDFDPKRDRYDSTLSTAIRVCKKETGITPPRDKTRIVNDIYSPHFQFAGAINQVWKFSFDNGCFVAPVTTELRAEWVPFSVVEQGEYDGLKIGPEIQAAIKATHGLYFSRHSKEYMQLYPSS